VALNLSGRHERALKQQPQRDGQVFFLDIGITVARETTL
jgi:hypothetical protein